VAKRIEARLKKIEDGFGINEPQKYPMAVMTLSPSKDATAQFGPADEWESYKQLISYCEAQNQTTIVFAPDPELEKKAGQQLLSQDELEQLRSYSPLID
jgi:hypothetical protein